MEAVEQLDLNEEQVFKTLIVETGQRAFAVAVLPVAHELNMKRFAAALGVKQAKMALREDAERVTGYVLGGISPVAQRQSLRTLIDSSAKRFSTIYVSAGRRGLEIELSADDLRAMTSGEFGDFSHVVN